MTPVTISNEREVTALRGGERAWSRLRRRRDGDTFKEAYEKLWKSV